MARKITELPELATQPNAGDEMVIVDVADGLTKRIQYSNLLAGGGGALPSGAPPADLVGPGLESAGVSALYSRGDHTHAIDQVAVNDASIAAISIVGTADFSGPLALKSNAITGPTDITIQPSIPTGAKGKDATVAGGQGDTGLGGGKGVLDGGPSNGAGAAGVVLIGKTNAPSIESGLTGVGSTWTHEGSIDATALLVGGVPVGGGVTPTNVRTALATADGDVYVDDNLEVVGDLVTQSLFVDSSIRKFGQSAPLAALTANQNDWAPTDYGIAVHIRFTTDASRDITGIAASTSWKLLVLHNVGSFNAVLKNQSVSSTAENRFVLPQDVTLAPGASLAIVYDAVTTRWRPIDLAALATKDAPGLVTGEVFDRLLSSARKKVNLMRIAFGMPVASFLGSTVAGAGAAVNQVATGYWQVQPNTGTTAAGAASMRSIVNNVYTGPASCGGYEMEVRSNMFDALPDGSNDYIAIVAAFLNSTFVTSGFGFIYDSAISANWQAFTLAAGVYTYIDTGVAAAIGTTPQTQPRFKTELVGDTTTGTLFWYIDGVQVATAASAVGNAVNAGYFVPARIVKTLGTSARRLSVSWLDINQTYVSEHS